MSHKLRILHLTHEMAIGGTQQVISQLVTHLDSDRYTCEIACIDGKVGSLGEKLQSNGLKCHVFYRSSGFDLALVKSIRHLLKEGRFDIVHCHQYTPFVYGALGSLLTGVKVVFTEHGRFYPDSYSWKRRLVNPALGRLADTIIVISAATGRALARYEWFAQKQINVIYNGTEPSTYSGDSSHWRAQFEIPEGALVYGTIARFDSIKNIPMMIYAFQAIHAENPDTRLLLVGDGEERSRLEQIAVKLGLAGAVIFTGFQQETTKLMSIIDIYLLSSFSEGTSMTLLEAMSCGTCCIVTAVGGNVELIEHDVNGIVVESEDTEELASWMMKLAIDKDRRDALGNEAKRVFDKKFSINRMIESYSTVYNKAL